ncbi:MAG: hypothetical protein JXA82_04395 [Sedimentisphaerales bacterium]|nr:hypothetical protein [Sedimentisphaerales bacterium]
MEIRSCHSTIGGGLIFRMILILSIVVQAGGSICTDTVIEETDSYDCPTFGCTAMVTMTGGYVYNLTATDSCQILVSGGQIIDAYARGHSHFIVVGGEFSDLMSYDSSLISIGGGHFGGIQAEHSSVVEMTDGIISSWIWALDNSRVNIRGGMIGGYIVGVDNSEIHIFGRGLRYDPDAVSPDLPDGHTGGAVYGRWVDGTDFLVYLCDVETERTWEHIRFHRVLHVDRRAIDGADDGSSWSDAFTDLQVALDEAQEGDIIWAAQGVYRPAPPEGGREISFLIDKEIMVKGGYAGLGASDPDLCDPAMYPSILSGDLNGDDAVPVYLKDLVTMPQRADNSYHVVVIGTGDREIVLDGFVIAGGQADGETWKDKLGGGIYGYGSGVHKAIVQNCILEGNMAWAQGGGAYSSSTFQDCIVRSNCAESGGGLAAGGQVQRCLIEGNFALDAGGGVQVLGSPHVIDCMIRANMAGSGGGLSTVYDDPLVERCQFMGNTASNLGGGVYSYNCDTCYGYPRFYQCLFNDNFAGGDGGAVYEGGVPEIWLVNCTIWANQSMETCGGVYIAPGWADYWLVANSILWGNEDQEGRGHPEGQISRIGTATGTGINPDSLLQVYHCCIEGLTDLQIGNGNTGLNPLFVDPAGPDLRPGTEDDDLHLSEGSPCINAGDKSYYNSTGTGTGTGTSSAAPATLDLDGNPRVKGGAVDIGAYEYEMVTPDILYVDGDANSLPVHDGRSWETAFEYLQDALRLASYGTEIRIAGGIYQPDQGPSGSLGDREATFQLSNGVILKGGYAGFGQSDPDWRDVQQYETVLSGDLLNNDLDINVVDPCDVCGHPSRSDNSYHVVTASDCDLSTVLDGITIRDGNANGNTEVQRNGAGIYHGDIFVRNCRILNNSAVLRGAGAHGYTPGTIAGYTGAGSIFEQCRIIGNVAFFGAGIVYPREVNDCIVEDNRATFRAGGILLGLDGKIADSLIRSNHAVSGAGLYVDLGRMVITNCTITENLSSDSGGGLYIHSSTGSNWTLEVLHCRIIGNIAKFGGGVYSDFEGQPVFTNCLIANNRATQKGGGVYDHSYSGANFSFCTIAFNHAEELFGGLYYEARSSSDGRPNIRLNHTIVWANSDSDGSAQLHHSNWEDSESSQQPEVHIDYCCIQDWTGQWGGSDNFSDDPLFADPGAGDFHLKSQAGRWNTADANWITDDLTSPCIDAGDSTYPIMEESFPNGGIINIGAYAGTAQASKSWFGNPNCKVVITGDLNGDCKVNLRDFALMAAHWMETR